MAGGSWGMGGQWVPAPTTTKKKPTRSGGTTFTGTSAGTGGPVHGDPIQSGPLTPAAPKPPGQVTDNADALAQLQQILNMYGLGGLAQWAWGELTAGKTEAQIVLDLYQTPEFQERFPGIGMRQQAGLPPISPADYVNYENSAIALMNAAGLPASMWHDRTIITKLIGGNTSLNELQDRVQMAAQAVYAMPQAVRDAAQRFYGITEGHWAQAFLDPDTPEPLLAQQFLAAQIGGAGQLAGYATDRQLAERLAAEGVTFQGAQSGFNDLGLKHQLFTPLAGEHGQAIDQNTQIAAEFEGNAAAQHDITRVARQRVARFQGSGGFQETNSGFSGLSTAQ